MAAAETSAEALERHEARIQAIALAQHRFLDPVRASDELTFLNEVFTDGRKAMRAENARLLATLVEEIKRCPPQGLLLHGIQGDRGMPLNGRPVTAIEKFDFNRNRYQVRTVRRDGDNEDPSQIPFFVKPSNLRDSEAGGSGGRILAAIENARMSEEHLRWDAIDWVHICRVYDHNQNAQLDYEEFECFIGDLLHICGKNDEITNIAREVAKHILPTGSGVITAIDARLLKEGTRDQNAFRFLDDALPRGLTTFGLFKTFQEFLEPITVPPNMQPPSPPFEAGGVPTIVRVQEIEQDYIRVCELLKKTYPTCEEIKCIHRWHHPHKLEQYNIEKQQMNARSDDVGANEKELWHGAGSEATLEKIRQNGFNRTFSTVAAYGYGVYFARDASYSATARYAVRTHEGTEILILARVLVGQSTEGYYDYEQGTHDARAPTNGGELFDSLFGGNESPEGENEIIVSCHNDNQAYAEYTVEYYPDLTGQLMRITGVARRPELNGKTVRVQGRATGGGGGGGVRYICDVATGVFIAGPAGITTNGETVSLKAENLARVRNTL